MQTDEVLTPELKACIGRTSGPHVLPEEICASDVRRYVNATGDVNPLWLDDDFAREFGYPGRVVPPGLVTELSWRTAEGATSQTPWHGDLPLPERYTVARNAGLDIEWLRPVHLGDRLAIAHRIAAIEARQGRSGLGLYITRESQFRNHRDELVALVRQTMVRLPAPSDHETRPPDRHGNRT